MAERRHKCRFPRCDGTRFGHELARDFHREGDEPDEAVDRLMNPDDYVKPENLQVTETLMTGEEHLRRLQAEAGSSGFHRDLRAWVDDQSSVARVLRHIDEEDRR